jgi:hypothetical protein
MTTLLVALDIAALAILVPLVLYSLVTGSAVPENSPFAKYHRAERYLGVAGTVFLIAICVGAAARLARHFGYFDAGLWERLELPSVLVFLALLFGYLALWIRARVKVGREGSTAS